MRTERAHVPGTALGVAHDDVHGLQRRLQFFGQHLRQGGNRPLAHLDLAGETGHPAILADPQEGIEVGRQAPPPALAAALLRQRPIAQRDKDEDAAAQAFEETPAGVCGSRTMLSLKSSAR